MATSLALRPQAVAGVSGRRPTPVNARQRSFAAKRDVPRRKSTLAPRRGDRVPVAAVSKEEEEDAFNGRPPPPPPASSPGVASRIAANIVAAASAALVRAALH